ncbi:MAG TPA: RpiB/LacA/LacB family sugar-phosphate isomerase [Candidatus Binatia bacterium]|jgi:ribose 5-phosphate isomerase B|nr:RpiB/LacA/LacB family sugar-phosphate isomerase [Candidatus Binatia bacterium]
MSREHNNSNILVLGAGITERSLAGEILDVWLNTPFAGGRHQRRIDKIAEVERELGTRIQDRPKY